MSNHLGGAAASRCSKRIEILQVPPAFSAVKIKGQAFGTTAEGDGFGIVAEQIGAAKVGSTSFKFTKGAHQAADYFLVSATGPGPTGLASDFAIGEALG